MRKSKFVVPQNSKQPLVSVIIPVFKATRYIPLALDSLRAQTFRDFEVILTNDGDPDTENLERALEPYRGEIVYLKSGKWASPSGSRNNGIRASQARYVAFLDADDLWEPEYLSTHVRILESDPAIDIVHTNPVMFGHPNLEGKTLMPGGIPAGETTFRQVILQERVIFVGVTARRESLLQAGLFDPAVLGGEDWDLWMRVLRNGGRMYFSGQSLARYRFHAQMQSDRKMEVYSNHMSVLDKHLAMPGLSDEQRGWFETRKRTMQAEKDLYLGKQALYRGAHSEALELMTRSHAVLPNRRLGLAILGLRLAPGLLRGYIRRKYPTEYSYLH